MTFNKTILHKVKAGASAVALAGAMAIPSQAELTAGTFDLGYAIAQSNGGSNSLGESLAVGGGAAIGAWVGGKAGASTGFAFAGPAGAAAGFFIGAL